MDHCFQRLETLAPAGYTAGVHIRFAAPLYLKSTYPEAWQELYADNSYALRDPLVFWGISKVGRTRWSEVALPDPFGVLRQAAEHGLPYGAVVSCGKITSRTIVGVARADREFTDAEIAEVEAAARDLHAQAAPPADLAPEEKAALRLVDGGRSPEVAATVMGMPRGELEGWLAAARDRLGVATTGEALDRARAFKMI